jgi:hypothetical protein
MFQQDRGSLSCDVVVETAIRQGKKMHRPLGKRLVFASDHLALRTSDDPLTDEMRPGRLGPFICADQSIGSRTFLVRR